MVGIVMSRKSWQMWVSLACLAAASSMLGGCMGPDNVGPVPVRIHVTNRTDDPITVRWKDNKISGESDPIAPGTIGDVNASYTNRGAGDLRLAVIGRDGQTIRNKRFDADVLRAAGFSRRLTVTSSGISDTKP
jgi:hypothetical protein